jgi:hypothetical protein
MPIDSPCDTPTIEYREEDLFACDYTAPLIDFKSWMDASELWGAGSAGSAILNCAIAGAYNKQ